MSKLNEAEVRQRAEHLAGLPTSLVLDLKQQQCIRELLDLIENQDKVIERLPKTADGVPIFVGIEVWLPGFPRYPGFVDCIMDDEVGVNDMSEWPAHGCETIRHCTVRDPYSLYSTREAAEAARNKETT